MSMAGRDTCRAPDPARTRQTGAELPQAWNAAALRMTCRRSGHPSSPVQDFSLLKRETEAEVKDLKRDVADLGQHMNTLEQTHDAHVEELDCHRRDIIALQDKNQELQYQLEDLENRSRRSNIRIKRVPA
ncbi:hypothetical protein NDU88_000742 [Pleurodeles waltl]|uniref:Uncharacterized protein n=1 Tax=Pleurodeles waltl TaxID=8319 RepID=A0AAV7WIG5_PLEWA|nr:hypothetical protein NDU88_000742 [Pleurodeles waltl]